nr:hypothetical protein [Clostridia bacterium]
MNSEQKINMNPFIRVLSFIFSFLVPVVGTGMWWFYRKKDSRMAKIYLIISILGFICNYALVSWMENYTGISVG